MNGKQNPTSGENRLTQFERLLRAEGAPIRLWYLPRSTRRNRVSLDEETIRYLRALGYIE